MWFPVWSAHRVGVGRRCLYNRASGCWFFYRLLPVLDRPLTVRGDDLPVQVVFEWASAGIGLLIGAGAAFAAVGVLLFVLNRRTARQGRPEP